MVAHPEPTEDQTARDSTPQLQGSEIKSEDTKNNGDVEVESTVNNRKRTKPLYRESLQTSDTRNEDDVYNIEDSNFSSWISSVDSPRTSSRHLITDESPKKFRNKVSPASTPNCSRHQSQFDQVVERREDENIDEPPLSTRSNRSSRKEFYEADDRIEESDNFFACITSTV